MTAPDGVAVAGPLPTLDAMALSVFVTRDEPVYQQTRDLVIRSMHVTDDASINAASDFVRTVRSMRAKIDAERKRIGDPFRSFVENVNGLFRPALDACDEMANVLRDRIAAHVSARDKASREAMALSAATVAGGMVPTALQPPPVDRVAARVSVRERWVGDVTDPEQVPRYLCSPDLAKIAGICAGHDANPDVPPPAVPGIAFRREASATVRR